MQIRQLVVDIGTNGAVAEFSGGKLTVTGIEPGQLFAALGEIEKIIAPKQEEPKRAAICSNSVGLEMNWERREAAILRDVPSQNIVGVDMASGPDKTVTAKREVAPEAKPALDGNGAKAFLKEEAAKIQPAAVEPPRREAKPSEVDKSFRAHAKPADFTNLPGENAVRVTVPVQMKPARAADHPASALEAPELPPADDAPSEDDDSPEALDARLKASAQRDAEWKARLAEKEAERAKGPVRDALKKEDPAALVEALRNTPRPTPPPPKPAASDDGEADEPADEEDDVPASGAIPNFGVEEREYLTMNAAVRNLVQANRGKPILEDVDALAVAFLPFCRKWIKPIRELPGDDAQVLKEFTRRFKILFATSAG